jgi:hypothetical protein
VKNKLLPFRAWVYLLLKSMTNSYFFI